MIVWEQIQRMTYSVLMAVYGKEKPEFFRQSIESMLAQTLPFSDFVLVCDGPLPQGLNEVVAWAQEADGRKASDRPSEGE